MDCDRVLRPGLDLRDCARWPPPQRNRLWRRYWFMECVQGQICAFYQCQYSTPLNRLNRNMQSWGPPIRGKSDISLCVALPRYRNRRPNRDVLYQSFHRPPLSAPVSSAWHGALAYLVEVSIFLNSYCGPTHTWRIKTCLLARAEISGSPQFPSNLEMPFLVWMKDETLTPSATIVSGSSSTGIFSTRSPLSSPSRPNAPAKPKKLQWEKNALINTPCSSALVSSMLWAISWF